MLTRINLDKYSSMQGLDTLLVYLSKRMVSNLTLQKIDNMYRIEYSTATSGIDDNKDVFLLQDDVQEFRMAFLLNKIEDYYIFFDAEAGVYVVNKYGVDTSDIDAIDEIFEALEHIRMANAILHDIKIQGDYVPLGEKTPKTGKYKNVTVERALDVIHNSIADAYDIVSDGTVIGG